MRHALTLSLAAATLLAALQAQAAEQTRDVPPFSTIANSGTMNLTIEVGKPQSVVASGSDEFVADVQTEVVDGELRIHVRRDPINSGVHWDDRKLTIAVPRLSAVSMSGAGAMTITHMSGDNLAVRFAGAGSFKADGTVRRLTLDVGGVGSIDTRELHADSASVNVGGVGSVRVWASQRLDASVGGVGSLTYYGDPKTVNTSGGGLGSISKAR